MERMKTHAKNGKTLPLSYTEWILYANDSVSGVVDIFHKIVKSNFIRLQLSMLGKLFLKYMGNCVDGKVYFLLIFQRIRKNYKNIVSKRIYICSRMVEYVVIDFLSIEGKHELEYKCFGEALPYYVVVQRIRFFFPQMYIQFSKVRRMPVVSFGFFLWRSMFTYNLPRSYIVELLTDVKHKYFCTRVGRILVLI